MMWTVQNDPVKKNGTTRSHVPTRWFVRYGRAIAGHREAVMNRWHDRKFEHVLLVYMLAWAIALLVTHILTE